MLALLLALLVHSPSTIAQTTENASGKVSSTTGNESTDNSVASPKVNKIVKRMEAINILVGPDIPLDGIGTQQYEYFMELSDQASQKELQVLTRHPNGVVRCYAFWALADKPDTNLLELVRTRILDTDVIKELLKKRELYSIFGKTEVYIPLRRKVGDVCICLVTDESTIPGCRKLTSDETEKLGYLLAITPNDLYETRELVGNVVPTSEQCIQLRQTYLDRAFMPALVALAGGQNEQDLSLIAASLDREPNDWDGYELAYKAIRRFPHPALLPHLKKQILELSGHPNVHHPDISLYQAIASYQNQEAADLLQLGRDWTPADRPRWDQKNEIFQVVNQNKCRAYDDILWQYWETEHLVTVKGLSYLNGIDPERCFLNAQNFIKAVSDPYMEDRKRNNMLLANVNVLPQLMQIVAEEDRDFAVTATVNLINNVKWSYVEIVAKIADDLHDLRFIEPLMNRLEKNEGAQSQLKLVLTLLKYNDENVNRRLVNAWHAWPNLQSFYIHNKLKEIFTERGLLSD